MRRQHRRAAPVLHRLISGQNWCPGDNVDTGEGPHLSHDEKVRVLQIVRDVTDIPIVAACRTVTGGGPPGE
jgi:hypothetical protein